MAKPIPEGLIGGAAFGAAAFITAGLLHQDLLLLALGLLFGLLAYAGMKVNHG